MEKINKYGDGSNNKELVITDKFGNVKSIFQKKITLTTTGSTGPATFVNNILNIPQYSSALTGYVPTSRRLEINGISYDLSADRSWSVGTVTSVGVSMPSAFAVANSPITSSGTIAITGAGNSSQYIDGTGALRPFPGLTGYVPYVGATQNVNLGEFGITAGQFTLDVSPTGTATVGTTRWNNTIGSSETTLKGGNVILKNGVDLVARVVNKVTPNTTLTKANYPAVRVSGAQGQRLAVAYAQANNDNNSADTIGLVVETIATNQEGFIMTVGQLNDVNTTGSLQGETWADGDVLYLSPTTPGALTNVKPTGLTGHIVVMGYVEYAHAVHGSIYVKIMNGWELDELHNVYINNPLNNQGLFYNASDQLWKNKSIDSALGYTPVPDSRRLTINGTAYDLTADRTWSVGTVTSVTASSPLSSSGGTTPNITISQATGSTNGYLSSADWTTFNSKQPAGNYITSLSGEATGSGPGTASVTLNNASVTAKVLTGVNITGGSISASDSILTAFGKLQNQINGLIGSSVYQGTWNAATNTPALASGVGTRGYYYIVNVAGSTNLDGITDWNVGDWAIFDGTAWQQVDNTDSVTSVNGQTGAVSLTTDNIPEGATNLYFTQLRSRQSITLTTSGSSGAATYNNGTGALNIPNYTLSGLGGVPSSRRLEINGISYDLSADRSWSVGTVTSIATSGPLTGGTITGSGTIGINQASATDDGYLSSTDWNIFNNKQNTITLTTTGTSGPATLIGSTLNIPQYQSVITNPVTGTGAANYVARWTSSSNIGTGILYDTGSLVGVNTTAPGKTLDVFGDVRFQSANSRLDFTVAYNGLGDLPAGILLSTWATANNNLGIIPSAQGTVGSKVVLGAYNGSVWRSMVEFANTSGEPNLLLAKSAGNVGIGTTSPGSKLHLSGTNTFLTITDTTYNRTSSVGYLDSANLYLANDGGSNTYIGRYNNVFLAYGGGSVAVGNTTPTQLVDIGISGAQKSLRVRGTYNFDGSYLSSATSNGGAKIEFVAHTGVSTSSAYRIQHDRDQTPDLIFSYAGSAAAYSSLSYSELMRLDPNANLGLGTSAMTVINGYRTFTMDAPSGTFTEYRQNTVNHMRIGADGGRPFIYCESPNPLDIYTGASFTMRLAANGNIGIGTTNPQGKLAVDGGDFRFNYGNSSSSYYFWLNKSSSADGGILLTRDNSLDWQIVNNTGTGDLGFYSYGSGSQALYIKRSSANVGIGTTNPTQKLSVIGNIYANGGFIGYRTDGGIGLEVNGGDMGPGTFIAKFNDYTNASRVVINGVGDVGIGTTTPTKYMSSTETLMSIVNSNVASLYLYSTTGHLYNMSSISNGDLFWYDVSAGTERMRLTGSGDFGIGTSSPLSKLHVDGNSGIRISAASNSDYRGIIFAAAAGDSTEYSSIKWQPNSGEFRISANPSGFGGYMSFYSNAAEAMRITASGNVGIGTTAPSVKLEVSGQAFVDKFQYNQAIQISGADLNGVTTAGFYAGSGLTNAPDNNGWYWVTVERHSDSGWVHQLATSYGAGNTENLMYSRVKMNNSTWTAWKKISYSTDTPTATSVYDLLPNARVDFNWVGQVVNGTWVDIFTRANNVLTSGTWMVNMYVSDYATGGEHYQYTYSGTFTWYQGGTNQNGTPAASEIALHRMGHAANSTVLYLRTTEEAAADGGNGHFQITGNYSHFANTTINFKFVKII